MPSTQTVRRQTATASIRRPFTPARGNYLSKVHITIVTANSSGRVFCAMWRGPDGYPTKRKKAAHEGIDRHIVEERATIVFDGVRAGQYAVACFHDENNNNDLDLNFLGIPIEATGASNDARAFFGPPSYGDAHFTVSSMSTKRIVVPTHYVF